MVDFVLQAQDFQSTSPVILRKIIEPGTHSVELLRPQSPELTDYLDRVTGDVSMEPAYEQFFKALAPTDSFITLYATQSVGRLSKQEVEFSNGQKLVIGADLALMGEGCEALFSSIRDAGNTLIASTDGKVVFHPGDLSEGQGLLRYMTEAQYAFEINTGATKNFHQDGLTYTDPRSPWTDSQIEEDITPFTMLINFIGPKTRKLKAQYYDTAKQLAKTLDGEDRLAKAVQLMQIKHGVDTLLTQAELNSVFLFRRDGYSTLEGSHLPIAAIHAEPEHPQHPTKRLTLVLRGYIDNRNNNAPTFDNG